jgi:putative solute:sodium symporter small subunit
MAAQGLVVGYLLLIAFYAWAMQRLDRMLTENHDHGR